MFGFGQFNCSFLYKSNGNAVNSARQKLVNDGKYVISNVRTKTFLLEGDLYSQVLSLDSDNKEFNSGRKKLNHGISTLLSNARREMS